MPSPPWGRTVEFRQNCKCCNCPSSSPTLAGSVALPVLSKAEVTRAVFALMQLLKQGWVPDAVVPSVAESKALSQHSSCVPAGLCWELLFVTSRSTEVRERPVSLRAWCCGQVSLLWPPERTDRLLCASGMSPCPFHESVGTC